MHSIAFEFSVPLNHAINATWIAPLSALLNPLGQEQIDYKTGTDIALCIKMDWVYKVTHGKLS